MEGEQSRVAPNSGRADAEAMSTQYKAENRMGCVRSHPTTLLRATATAG